MKSKFILLLLLSYFHGNSCSFHADAFCSTIYSTHPEIIILRGYFSEDFENGSVFTILEVLRGEEEQTEIKVWDHLPFDCNGIIQRTTDQMGATNQEIVATFTKIDSVGFHDGEELGDYRVPEEIWWQSHALPIEGNFVSGNIIDDDSGLPQYMLYSQFIEIVINTNQCNLTSTSKPQKLDVVIYPSITREYLNVDFTPILNQGKVTIYDFNGQRVMHKKIVSRIDVGMLKEGIYVAIIHLKGKPIHQQKFIKQY
ncbi:MAG: T9SS type A sorting domain-containing protein [Saprospiraceae bacterium]|nr:T9SS type A sorting domain-containing protein [Saprospiraceae bacterium]